MIISITPVIYTTEFQTIITALLNLLTIYLTCHDIFMASNLPNLRSESDGTLTMARNRFREDFKGLYLK